jgi:prevent-host-death family protein
MQYNVLEARDQFSKLVDAAANGEDVVIAKRGKPVARIVKIDDSPAVGSSELIAKWLDENPIPPGKGRTSEEIDRELREERDSWN